LFFFFFFLCVFLFVFLYTNHTQTNLLEHLLFSFTRWVTVVFVVCWRLPVVVWGWGGGLRAPRHYSLFLFFCPGHFFTRHPNHYPVLRGPGGAPGSLVEAFFYFFRPCLCFFSARFFKFFFFSAFKVCFVSPIVAHGFGFCFFGCLVLFCLGPLVGLVCSCLLFPPTILVFFCSFGPDYHIIVWIFLALGVAGRWGCGLVCPKMSKLLTSGDPGPYGVRFSVSLFLCCHTFFIFSLSLYFPFYIPQIFF